MRPITLLRVQQQPRTPIQPVPEQETVPTPVTEEQPIQTEQQTPEEQTEPKPNVIEPKPTGKGDVIKTQ